MKADKIRTGSLKLHMLIQSMGTVVSQAIPIIISPILTRIFSPEDFGLYGFVLSISALLAIFITLRIDHGVVVSSSIEEARQIVHLSTLMAGVSTLAVSAGAAIVVTAFNYSHTQFMIWVIFGPLLAFLTASNRTLTLFNNRIQSFGAVSKARIAQSIAIAIASSGLGFFSVLNFGLVWGLIAGNALYVIILARSSLPFRWVDFNTALNILRANRDFVRFSLPGALVNTLASRVPFILFPVFFGLEQTGYLNLAYRVVATPSRFIGTAIGEVFYSHAAREYERNGSCWGSAKKVASVLAGLGILGFLLLFVIAEPLFEIAFGSEWKPAAQYTKALVPMLLISFVVSPLSIVLYIAGRQKEDFLWQIAFLLVVFFSCLAGLFLGGAYSALIALSVGGSVMYGLYFILIRRFAGAVRQA